MLPQRTDLPSSDEQLPGLSRDIERKAHGSRMMWRQATELQENDMTNGTSRCQAAKCSASRDKRCMCHLCLDRIKLRVLTWLQEVQAALAGLRLHASSQFISRSPHL